MRRAFSASGSARSVTLLTLFYGGLTLSACVGSSDGDIFESERCALGEETCGCRVDKTCNGALACLSDLCVDVAGAAGTKSSGGTSGSAAGSAGVANQNEGGNEDKSGSGGTVGPGTGGDGSSGGASDDENGGSGPGEPGSNLIENGDFSDAETLWTIEPAQANRSIADGALCLTIQAGESVSLGWPPIRRVLSSSAVGKATLSRTARPRAARSPSRRRRSWVTPSRRHTPHFRAVHQHRHQPRG